MMKQTFVECLTRVSDIMGALPAPCGSAWRLRKACNGNGDHRLTSFLPPGELVIMGRAGLSRLAVLHLPRAEHIEVERRMVIADLCLHQLVQLGEHPLH